MSIASPVAAFVTRRSGLCFLLGLAFAALCILGLARAQMENDYRAYFDPDDPGIAATDWLQSRQGQGADALALIYAPGDGDAFGQMSVLQIEEIMARLTAQPHVIAVEAWPEAERLVQAAPAAAQEAVPADGAAGAETSEDTGAVGDGAQAPDRRAAALSLGLNIFDEAGRAALRARALDTPTVGGRLVSADGSAAVVRVFVDFDSSDPEREGKLGALRAEIAALQADLRQAQPADRLLLVGATMFDQAAAEVLRQDMRILAPAAFLLVGAILYWFFRSWRFMGMGLALVTLPAIAAAGATAGVGAPFSTLAVSGLMLVGTLAVADVLHIASGFFLRRAGGQGTDAALEGSVAANLWPVFATTLTTAIGQIAMLSSASPPIRVMGLVVSLGVWIALVVTVLMLPAILRSCDRVSVPALEGAAAALARFGLAGMRRPGAVLAGVATVSFVCLVAIGGARIGDSLGGWFSERTEFRQGMDLLNREFRGGGGALTLAVEAPRADQRAARAHPAPDPALDAYAGLQDALDAAAPDGAWHSPVTLARWARDEADLSVPPALAETLPPFTAETAARSGVMTRLQLGARDYSLWTFAPATQSSFGLVETAERASAAAAEGAGDRNVRTAGLGLAFARLSVSNFHAIVIGSAVAIGLISATMCAVFASFRMGLLSLAPNIAPILAALGVWSLFHDQINMAAATVVSVAIGLVVDDTIHVLAKYRSARPCAASPEAAFAQVARGSGPGILATTLVIAGGFMLLACSGFLLTAQKAGLVGMTVALALVFDLGALPALLRVADRWLFPAQAAAAKAAAPALAAVLALGLAAGTVDAAAGAGAGEAAQDRPAPPRFETGPRLAQLPSPVPDDSAEPRDLPPAATDAAGPLTPEAHGIACDGAGPCIITAIGQPLRVLPRARSRLADAPAADAQTVRSSLPGLSPLFVYGIDELDLSDPGAPKGFYRVGAGRGGAEGWLAAADALEWRQAMILHFEHPGEGADRRHPTLFFRSLEALRDVAAASDRAAATADIREAIAGGAAASGVIAREPAAYVDISEKLYIYPVIDWRRDEDSVEKARYLKTMTASPQRRSAESAQAISAGTIVKEQAGVASFDRLDVDIVFALDMTGSMQPYIQGVRDAMISGADYFGEEFANARQVRYGLVGYRDDAERTPELGFAARNFTAEGLVEAHDLVEMLDNGGQPLAANVSSDEWAEAILPGLVSAIEETPWSGENSLRLVILIGDASGHEPGHKAYPEGLDTQAVRRLASDRNVTLLGAYIQNERAKADWARAQGQFAALTTNPGSKDPAFGEAASEFAGFTLETMLLQFAQDSVANAEAALAEQNADGAGPAPGAAETPPRDMPADDGAEPPPQDMPDAQAEAIADKWGKALRLGVVDYLGDAQEAPVDFTGWVLDNDLAQPNRRAVGVRVLTSRAELDALVRRLEVLTDALSDERMSTGDFFLGLQDLSARAGLDIELQRDADLAESEFLPAWIEALPYRSEVLSLRPRDLEEMSEQSLRDFRQRVGGKLAAYRAILADTAGWFPLDRDAEPLEHVYPLALEALP